MAKISSHVQYISRLNHTGDKFVPFSKLFFFLSVKMRCVGLYETSATKGIQNQHVRKYLTNTSSLIRPNNSSVFPFVKFNLCLHS